MKLLYFDCFSGAAGDMILGALIDAGLPLAELKRALGSLGAGPWDVSADRVVKGALSATKFRVHDTTHAHGDPHAPPPSLGPFPPELLRSSADTSRPDHGRDPNLDPGHDHSHGPPHAHTHTPQHAHTHHPHRTLGDIKAAIDQSALSAPAIARAKALFDRLAEAEAAVHEMPVERVHLHEVGALDSLIDIVGAVFALEWFAADQIVVSPMNVGSGSVRTAHGLFPVPAPATLRLLGDAPVYGREASGELLTPTGALVLTDYATSFGPMPAMRVERVGYGAGDRELPGTPNVLRVVVGQSTEPRASVRVVVIECEIDDMNPQILGALMEKLQDAGALDVFYSSVQMKKNRPGTLVTILAPPDRREPLTELMFRESTTIGVRHVEMERECLDRETVRVATPLGEIRFKVARRHGRVLNAQPEFDDIARLAAERGLPMKEVQAIATKSWLDCIR